MSHKAEITVTVDLPTYPTSLQAKLDELEGIWSARYGEIRKRVLLDVAFDRAKTHHIITITAREL